MATSTYFQNYSNFFEQQLIDDLVIESIKIYGIDSYYITRDLRNVDSILNEDAVSVFNGAYATELYVKTVDGFEGEGDFLSKFGLQIRDQATFTIAIRAFEANVNRMAPTIKRPKEGDLIWLPMNNKFFKIIHVEHESVFYQMGKLQVYDLKTELFEYSNERFETGVYDIDHAYDNYKTTEIDNLTDLKITDPFAHNIDYENTADDIVDWSDVDPFKETITFPTDTGD